MNRLKISIVFLAHMFIAQPLFSQISNYSDVGGKPLMIKKYDKVEGTPYYFGTEKWSDGTLYLADGKKIENISLRYNGYDDEVEYRRDGKVLIIENYNLKGFDMYVENSDNSNKIKYVFKNGFSVEGEIEKNEFFHVIYQGKNFSVVEKLEVVETRVAPASYGESAYQKFVNDKEGLIIYDNGVEKYKGRKNDVYNIVPGKKNVIKKKVKQDDLDLNNKLHLLLVLEYMDSNLFQ